MHRNQQVKSLNIYVDYLNECIHALWIHRSKLRNFNHDLNTYTRLDYNYDAGRYWTLNFETFQEILGNRRYFRPSAQELQDSLLHQNPLASRYQSTLQKPLNDFVNGIAVMKNYSDSIDQYLEKKEHLRDDSLKRGYALLVKFSLLYDEIDILKDALTKAIDQVYTDYFRAEGALLGAAYREWKAFLANAREVCNALRYKDSTEINLSDFLPEMEAQVKGLEEHLLTFIEGSKRYGPNHGRDPENRFQFCLRDAEAILSHMRSYIKAPAKSRQYRRYNREYHYYNERLLNKMNRYGVGLVQDFNLLLRSSDRELLKWVEEPHSFEIIRPQKKKEKPQQNPNTPLTLEGARPNHLIFLLDVSNSMNQKEKLPLLKEAFQELLNLLRPEDYVSIVTYSGNARVLLAPTSAQKKDTIRQRLAQLQSGGGTQATLGLDLAYQLGRRGFIPEGNNRILLATDGAFDLPKKYLKKVEKEAARDILMTVFFLGKTESPSVKQVLESLSQMGQGNYYHLKEDDAPMILIKEARQINQKE